MFSLVYLMGKLIAWSIKAMIVTMVLACGMCWLMVLLIALPFNRKGVGRQLRHVSHSLGHVMHRLL